MAEQEKPDDDRPWRAEDVLGEVDARRARGDASRSTHDLIDAVLDKRAEPVMRADDAAETAEADRTGKDPREPAAPIADPLIGGQIGPYRVLDRIGAGGMGVVYRAVQKGWPVRALKVVKPGMDTSRVLARFESEQQALKLMDHPNVARVFDAGSTPEGRPYFTMEFVAGIPITNHCDRRRLSVDERLRLFVQVCDAVQHAHQRGIIHRDLKPSNILVSVGDAGDVPKVIDFGLAKALHQPLTERPFVTGHGQIVGTIEYMSPEQLDSTAQDVDTRTDIYALGVLLYELLTGTVPFERQTLEAAGDAEMRRIIREDDPPRPSARLSSLGDGVDATARDRSAEGRSLLRRLRGELDWIVMKALEKDRGRRYRTADALAENIGLYLVGESVPVRPPTLWYRLTKLARRHRAAAVTAALVVLALCVGIVGASIRAQRAGALAIREATLRTQYEAILQFLESDEIDEALFEGEPLKEASLREHVGKYLLFKAGQSEGAIPYLERTLAIYGEELGDANLRTLWATTNLAIAYKRVGRLDDAEALFLRAIAMAADVEGSAKFVLEAQGDLANVYLFQDRLDEAEWLYGAVIEKKRATIGVGTRSTLRDMNNLALFYSTREKFEEARSLLGETIRVAEATLGASDEETIGFRGNLPYLLFAEGRLEEAEALFHDCIREMIRDLGEGDHRTLGARRRLARVYAAQGRDEAAEAQYRSTLARQQERLGLADTRTLQTLLDLVRFLRESNRVIEAADLSSLGLPEARRGSLAQGPVLGWLAAAHGASMAELGRHAEAEAALLEAYRVLAHVHRSDSADIRETAGQLIELYEAWGRPEEADRWRERRDAPSG